MLLHIRFLVKNLLPTGHSSLWNFQRSYEKLLLKDQDEDKVLDLFEVFGLIGSFVITRSGSTGRLVAIGKNKQARDQAGKLVLETRYIS
jgi:hypothetical protein